MPYSAAARAIGALSASGVSGTTLTAVSGTALTGVSGTALTAVSGTALTEAARRSAAASLAQVSRSDTPSWVRTSRAAWATCPTVTTAGAGAGGPIVTTATAVAAGPIGWPYRATDCPMATSCGRAGAATGVGGRASG